MGKGDVRAVVGCAWKKVAKQLNRPLHQVQISSLYQLPDGLTFFFDPKEKASKEAFKPYEEGTEDMIPAPQLVAFVMRIITQLEAAKVPRKHTVQLLKHCVAFVFSACRAYRREGENLFLPAFFMIFYKEAVRVSTNGRMSVSELPQIPLRLIKKHLNAEVQRICSFDTFGSIPESGVDNQGMGTSARGEIVEKVAKRGS
ncbi:hypothetical protein FGB62_139g233 [Gracilaria domingensis]|nr:hypothetical protein FGB62_139g233 [Gracilaria domingensis]